jgi:hypothetical protein
MLKEAIKSSEQDGTELVEKGTPKLLGELFKAAKEMAQEDFNISRDKMNEDRSYMEREIENDREKMRTSKQYYETLERPYGDLQDFRPE